MIVNPPFSPDLEFAFDVGHSSIGWAVLTNKPVQDATEVQSRVELLGCGAVTFRADDCLASSRRAYRRQRRHIRATRQRISRLRLLLGHLGVMTKADLEKPGCAWPWLLAAQVLKGVHILTWPELWDVLRWYAHNRGYDGNEKWAAEGKVKSVDQDDDTEKVENAKTLMQECGTGSMAETVCKVSGIDLLGKKRSCHVEPAKRFKAKNAAFPREVVEGEVRRVLEASIGKLEGVTLDFVKALLEDWTAVACPEIKVPKRYIGGLLFGQLLPRFDNRIIAKCPITDGKVPTRNCQEFLDFRWGMQLANIRVSGSMMGELKALDVAQREALDERIRIKGAFTAKELTVAVREITGCVRDNLETMLMHPDAKEALIVNPIQDELTSWKFWEEFGHLPQPVQHHARIWLSRGKRLSLRKCLEEAGRLKLSVVAFENALNCFLTGKKNQGSKKESVLTRDDILQNQIGVKKLSMRAAYSRVILKKAFEEVKAGRHPKEEGGGLFITEEMRKAQLNRPIADQSNNHLVRHRLLILERLFGDMVKEFAKGELGRIGQVTMEVNKDLRAMSGMTAKQKAQDLGIRLSNHKSVAAKLEKELGKDRVTAGLIRKARVAEDLEWCCPYTEQPYDIETLVKRSVDKDHIVPYSLRPSNSLDSLVITYAEINKMKRARTAMQFVMEEAGRAVPGRPGLTITTPERFKKFVEGLETFKGHEDDKDRKKRRKKLLLLEKYEEKEFTPGDLTQTSQLVRLAAMALRKKFQNEKQQPIVVSLPGAVTGAVRKSWNLLGCLAKANPQVLDEHGEVKNKKEIRDITHLHHALDACVLGLTSHFLPNTGRLWELLTKRNLSEGETTELKNLGVFGKGVNGRFELLDLSPTLKGQISERLAEKRVVQHVPARMDGLRAEQNIWRVVAIKDGEATLRQALRGPDEKHKTKETTEKTSKLLGVFPENGTGKLKDLKGALVIGENFGLVLDPEPQIIPFHKVPTRLAEFRKKNGGKPVRVLRNGQLIRVGNGLYKGIWKIFSLKNNSTGLALDMGQPDVVRLKNKTEGHKLNVSLGTLVKNGFEIIPRGLCGVPQT